MACFYFITGLNMKTDFNDYCPCGSSKKYRSCCGRPPASNTVKKYTNKAHEWMDKNILKGRYPDLYGFLILVDHNKPAEEIWDRFWSDQLQYIDFERLQRQQAFY